MTTSLVLIFTAFQGGHHSWSRPHVACCSGSLLVASSLPALAQQTTGNISGRALDPQGAAMPGVTVTAKNPQTGFTRAAVTDAEGIYRLSALPVGTYDLTVELQGFSTMERKGIVVNVGQTVELELRFEGRAASRRASPSPASRRSSKRAPRRSAASST